MYATREDLVKVYGSLAISELEHSKASLGNSEVSPSIEALEGASGLIDSYLATKYVVPVENNPRQLKMFCYQMAYYLLHTRQPPDDVKSRYTEILRWLRDVQSGKSVLTYAVPLSDEQKRNEQLEQPIIASSFSPGSAFSDDVFSKMPGIKPR